MASSAEANGRPPGTSTINFSRGDDTKIVAGMTFGVLASDDGGVSWRWMCEAAVGYGGMYDPDYAFAATGSLFATTFDGVKIRRDECLFEPSPAGMKFVSKLTVGADGAVQFAAADPTDANVYKSTDDGMTFPTSSTPGQQQFGATGPKDPACAMPPPVDMSVAPPKSSGCCDAGSGAPIGTLLFEALVLTLALRRRSCCGKEDQRTQ